jgi:hypothetical protein
MNKVFWLQPEDSKIGGVQKLIADRAGSPSFCVIPWIHMATRPNGDARLCCVTNASGAATGDHEVGLVKKENGQPANFGVDTPLSAWNNEYMRDVRTTMLEGKIPQTPSSAASRGTLEAHCICKCRGIQGMEGKSSQIGETYNQQSSGWDASKIPRLCPKNMEQV